MKKILLILALITLFSPKTTFAFDAVNKFGIHILEPSDLPKAQELVNSSGGDWGWVTVVIRDDDMHHDKWQDFMDQCRLLHLVPLVRIATHLEKESWVKPKIGDSSKWVEFLNNLNWPTADQYVIIFNEPNQAKEWGGEINPKEYAEILSEFIKKFHIPKKFPEGNILDFKFQILNAGLDLAAPNSKTTMNSYDFMKQMDEEVPGIFDMLDGWASHSYPNHGFLGKPWDEGKTSIRGYYWELNYLKQLGVKKELQVFITETGWPHGMSNVKCRMSKQQGKKCKSTYYDEEKVAEYIKYAFEHVWLKDERIRAVTPFVLNYPERLFSDFSWLDKEGNPYPQFDTLKNIGKISWWPDQETKYEVKSIILPPFLPASTEYKGEIIIKNIGQSIWGEESQIIFSSIADRNISLSDLVIPKGQYIKPSENFQLDFTLKSSSQSGIFSLSWQNSPKYQIKVLPTSILSNVRYTFWQKAILKLRGIFSWTNGIIFKQI